MGGFAHRRFVLRWQAFFCVKRSWGLRQLAMLTLVALDSGSVW